MLFLKKLLLVVVFFCFIAFGLVFASDNQELAELTLLGYPLPSVSVGLTVMLVLLLGIILGWLLSRISYFFIRRAVVKKDHIIAKQTEELKALRIAPLRD